MKYPLIVLLLVTAAAWGQEPQPLTLKNRIELPNVNGRIDHFSTDVKGQRLFVAVPHRGEQRAEVLVFEVK